MVEKNILRAHTACLYYVNKCSDMLHQFNEKKYCNNTMHWYNIEKECSNIKNYEVMEYKM